MKDVHHAVSTLREALKLPLLGFDDNGQFELVFEDFFHIDVVRISDTELELSTILADLDGTLTEARLIALLSANYHGHGTAAARLALNPDDGRVVLCERIDVVPLAADAFEARVLSFLKLAAFWLDEGTVQVLDTGSEEAASSIPSQDEQGDDLHFIRV